MLLDLANFLIQSELKLGDFINVPFSPLSGGAGYLLVY